jgi:hypothetical protein
MSKTSSIAILGSTGSIGQQALEVVSAHAGRFRVAALSAQRNLDLLVSQWNRFRPPFIGIAEERLEADLRGRLPAEVRTRLTGGGGHCIGFHIGNGRFAAGIGRGEVRKTGGHRQQGVAGGGG